MDAPLTPMPGRSGGFDSATVAGPNLAGAILRRVVGLGCRAAPDAWAALTQAGPGRPWPPSATCRLWPTRCSAAGC